MPSSSPYQNNDYQAANSMRPYRLPVNDIMKAFVSQNQFWDIGAQKVKSVYDNALGLSLTLDENKKVRDDYMKQAEKEINKLSAMDLSDPSVQRQGIEIFKPLLNDKSIILDNELTNLRNSIFSDAEGYKDKKLSKNGKEGEGYSDINLADALDGFENFKSDLPRDEKSLKKLYDQLKDKRYTPFYSPNEAMDKAISGCKGSTNSSITAQGLNDITTKSTGVDSATMRNCIESYLANDNKALEQIAINGRMQFKNDREGLISYVKPYLQKTIEDNEALLRDYQSKKLAAINSGKATKEDLDAFDQFIEKYKKGVKEGQDEYDRVSSDNWKEVDDNYRNWSQRIYKHNLVYSYAEPRATYGIEQTVSSDPERMEIFKQNQENARATVGYQKAVDLENLRSQNELKKVAFEKLYDKDTPVTTKMKLAKQFGFNLDNGNEGLLGNAEEIKGEDMNSLQKKLDENFTSSLNDLKDISTAIASIDNAELHDQISKNPVTQGDYIKVIESANSYLEGRAKLMGGTDKLEGADLLLLNSINNYKQKVAVSNGLNSIMTRARENAQQNNPEIYKNYTAAVAKIAELPYIRAMATNTEKGGKGEYIDIPSDIVVKALSGDSRYKVGMAGSSITIDDVSTKTHYEFYENNSKSKEYNPFRGGMILNAYNLLKNSNSNYVQKVNEELGKNQALNRLFYKTDDATEKEVTNTMQRIFPEAAEKQYHFKTLTFDPKSGEVKLQVLKDVSSTKQEAVNIDGLKDLQEKFGKSTVSVGSILDVKDGQLVMTVPSLKMEQRSYIDDTVDLMKEDLANRAKSTGRPIGEVVYTDRSLNEYQLYAVPMSSGTVYSIRSRKKGTGTFTTLKGMQNLSADKINVYINQLTSLDQYPEISQ